MEWKIRLLEERRPNSRNPRELKVLAMGILESTRRAKNRVQGGGRETSAETIKKRWVEIATMIDIIIIVNSSSTEVERGWEGKCLEMAVRDKENISPTFMLKVQGRWRRK